MKDKIIKNAAKARTFFHERKLFLALLIAVGLAVCTTFISVSIYNVTGFGRFDLSRPGYEKERASISKSPEKKTYDTTSTVTAASIDEFLVEFDDRVRIISGFGDFGDDMLGDDNLGISRSASSVNNF